MTAHCRFAIAMDPNSLRTRSDLKRKQPHNIGLIVQWLHCVRSSQWLIITINGGSGWYVLHPDCLSHLRLFFNFFPNNAIIWMVQYSDAHNAAMTERTHIPRSLAIVPVWTPHPHNTSSSTMDCLNSVSCSSLCCAYNQGQSQSYFQEVKSLLIWFCVLYLHDT